jgi:hypothetical protein
MTLEISAEIFIEINEILAESFSALVTRIHENLRHLEKSGRKWDNLNPAQKRKALIDIEDNINKDKELIKQNRLDFVLDGYQKLESFFANSSFDEIQDILLSIPSDLSDEIDKKITNLFPTISNSNFEDRRTQIVTKLSEEVVSKHFNPKSDGQDKDIMVELIIILAFGAKKRTFSRLTFFTEDKGFVRNYLKLGEAQKKGRLSEDNEIEELCKNTVPSLVVEIAY